MIRMTPNRFSLVLVAIFASLLMTGCYFGKKEQVKMIETPKEEPVVASVQPDPIEEPIEDPIEDPVEDPIEEPIEDPIEDPVEDPIEELVELAEYKDEAHGFSFQYPASYIKDDYFLNGQKLGNGLWKNQEKYDLYKDPADDCIQSEYPDFCSDPALLIYVFRIGDHTIPQFLAGLLGVSQEEFKDSYEYEKVAFGKTEFAKISEKDLIQKDGYFVKKGDDLIQLTHISLDERYDMTDEELKTVLSSFEIKN